MPAESETPWLKKDGGNFKILQPNSLKRERLSCLYGPLWLNSTPTPPTSHRSSGTRGPGPGLRWAPSRLGLFMLPGRLIWKTQAGPFICPGWRQDTTLPLYLKPPGSWLPGDRGYPATMQGTHSPGCFMQLGPGL